MTNDKTRTWARAHDILAVSPCGIPFGVCFGELQAIGNYHRYLNKIFAGWAHARDTPPPVHLLCNLDIFLWILYFWYEKRGSPKTYPVSNPETYPFSTPETYPFVEWGISPGGLHPYRTGKVCFCQPQNDTHPRFLFFSWQ